jgi:hypothetical protein
MVTAAACCLIIGAIFSAKTTNGAEMGVDYLPKIQARKLYQYAQERKEAEREARRLRELEEKRAESGSVTFDRTQNAPFQQAPAPAPEPVAATPPPAPVVPQEEVKPDVLTEKLKKLRTLFDSGLISQEEYNQKKLELLNDL